MALAYSRDSLLYAHKITWKSHPGKTSKMPFFIDLTALILLIQYNLNLMKYDLVFEKKSVINNNYSTITLWYKIKTKYPHGIRSGWIHGTH